jgi:hypothetical protein
MARTRKRRWSPPTKSMRRREHERAAFVTTGCIGIVLRQHWCHVSMMERAQLSVLWWEIWVQTVTEASWARCGSARGSAARSLSSHSNAGSVN